MVHSNRSSTVYLPNTLANWPWPRRINPYFEEVKAEANEWLRSFNALTPQSLKAFEKCDFGMTSPTHNISKVNAEAPSQHVLQHWPTPMLREVYIDYPTRRDTKF